LLRHDHGAYIGWRNELVIYEMQSTALATQPAKGRVRLTKFVPKLSDLHDLDVNAIEIMPVLEFPMSLLWGYNPSDLFAVESALGGPKGLQRSAGLPCSPRIPNAVNRLCKVIGHQG
jgi:1,4-alpha-glucan branching enzyme